jgi:hypothetical protein
MPTTIVLSKTQQELTGSLLAVTYTWEDVDGYTSATAVPIFDVKAGSKVQCTGMRLNTAFDVSGTGALALSVGDGGSATALLASTVIAVDGTEILYHVGGSEKVYLVDDAVDAFFTDATSMAYTSGSVTLFFNIIDLTKIANE